MWRKAFSAGLVLALSVACSGGNDSGLSREQLDWCGHNEAKVAEAALAMGLMDNGMLFSDWRASNPDDFRTACARALADNATQTALPGAT